MRDSTHRLAQLPSGVWTVHSATYGQVLHPGLGPAAEAQALYVRQLRLPERIAAHAGEFVVWDVGLGAAANALAAIEAALPLRCALRMLSFDNTLDTLAFALANREKLPYLQPHAEAVATLIETGRTCIQSSSAEVLWERCVGDFPALLADAASEEWPKPDAILFDPFSPACNPAMWTLPLFTQLRAKVGDRQACSLATYSRSTQVRVAMLLAGFFVGQGESSGPKEETTVAANRLELVPHPLSERWLEKVRRSGAAEPLMGADYRQVPLSDAMWARLRTHPQFAPASQDL